MTPLALPLLLITFLDLWDEKQHNFERDISNITTARFGFIWFINFRGEAFYVKVHDVWRANDDGRQVMANPRIHTLIQIVLYVNIIMTKYMPHVSHILLVPCLNIYPHPLYELKIYLTLRQPHPLCVLTLCLTRRPPHLLNAMTIGLTMRPAHPLYELAIS